MSRVAGSIGSKGERPLTKVHPPPAGPASGNVATVGAPAEPGYKSKLALKRGNGLVVAIGSPEMPSPLTSIIASPYPIAGPSEDMSGTADWTQEDRVFLFHTFTTEILLLPLQSNSI